MLMRRFSNRTGRTEEVENICPERAAQKTNRQDARNAKHDNQLMISYFPCLGVPGVLAVSYDLEPTHESGDVRLRKLKLDLNLITSSRDFHIIERVLDQLAFVCVAGNL